MLITSSCRFKQQILETELYPELVEGAMMHEVSMRWAHLIVYTNLDHSKKASSLPPHHHQITLTLSTLSS